MCKEYTEYEWDNVYFEDSIYPLSIFPDNFFEIGFFDQPWNIGMENRTECENKYNDTIPNYEQWCRGWFYHAKRVCEGIIMIPGNINMNMWELIEKPKDYFDHIATNRKKKPTPLTNKRGIDKYIFYGKFKHRLPADFIITPVKWGWMIKNDEDKIDHPDPKPEEVLLYFLKYFKPKTFLDPFVGSGVSLYACEVLGVKYMGFEINEEKYKNQIYKYIEKGRNNKVRKTKRSKSVVSGN